MVYVFFHILISNRKKNLGLGFRSGKFPDSGYYLWLFCHFF